MAQTSSGKLLFSRDESLFLRTLGPVKERGSLLHQDVDRSFGSIRAMAHRLWERFRNVLIAQEALDIAAAARIQIRLNSS